MNFSLDNQGIKGHFYPFNLTLETFSLQKCLKLFLLTRLNCKSGLQVAPNDLKVQEISLFRLSHGTDITYRCAIAFQLSRQSGLSPPQLAQDILALLLPQIDDSDELFPQLSVRVRFIEPGWLDFRLTDSSLAMWLQYISSLNFEEWQPSNHRQMSGNYDNSFLVNYAHARCCALLRLGDQEGIIQLNDSVLSSFTQPQKKPQPIPWLRTSEKNLWLSDPKERSLISCLVNTSDQVSSESLESLSKLATNLSLSFLEFERYCRIFGETLRETPELSQARLGLIWVTQQWLKRLWERETGRVPPVEL
ncbi:DALR anticodon-binding domain-containing protein [Aphanothece sacrum]|uniref:DalR anticodon-binding domain-containing protein n=1 Tax=Aphanothece sacrum FPU1 TaxID=1920663 RepID=A0A401IJX8_APHSA|nr:DALR anticodon-binding domain-containing protein [Aphanothece sacrum]GBF81411.1 DalR anticodon-binding domain-containing protein [Aphanothece sacrum FPU1]GBF85398.1 hypothetical protein AsFPU3_2457 [Aphanothece sacrum FPU3]